ncbi:MAG: 2'-5' RNA ligase family protein [Methylobacteriaceae bacterium]|nr:2'-5' RNA ligase family protein [Methylobacteriaceae bacterium]
MTTATEPETGMAGAAPLIPPVASLWLMPAPADAAWLSRLVGELAARHAAPLFVPHLTVAGDVPAPPESLTEELAAVARAAAPFETPIAAIDTGEAFFRSFYARFARAAPLDALKRAAVAAGLGGSLDDFMPHVSLLYGQPPPAAKAASAAQAARALVGRPVRFDRLALTTSGNDAPVADWRIVAERPLG